MLQDGSAHDPAGVRRQRRLREQPAHEPREDIAAAALGEPGVARRVPPRLQTASPHERRVALQHHPCPVEVRREPSQGTCAVGLHMRGSTAQQSAGLARMRRQHAHLSRPHGSLWKPIERGRIRDHCNARLRPPCAHAFRPPWLDARPRKARTHDDARDAIGHLASGFPGLDHWRGHLRRNGQVGRWMRPCRDQARVGTQRATEGQHGCAVIPNAARHHQDMPVAAIVPIHAPGLRPALEVPGPSPFARDVILGNPRGRPIHEPHIPGDTDAPDVAAGVTRDHAQLGSTHRQRFLRPHHGPPGRSVRRVQPRRHIHGKDPDAGRVECFDHRLPIRRKRPVQPDAEQAVHDQRGPRLQRRLQRAHGLGRVVHLQKRRVAGQQVRQGRTDVVAVVSLPGQQQHRAARGHAARRTGHLGPDPRDHVGLAHPGGP